MIELHVVMPLVFVCLKCKRTEYWLPFLRWSSECHKNSDVWWVPFLKKERFASVAGLSGFVQESRDYYRASTEVWSGCSLRDLSRKDLEILRFVIRTLQALFFVCMSDVCLTVCHGVCVGVCLPLLVLLQDFISPLWESRVTLPGHGCSSHKNNTIHSYQCVCTAFSYTVRIVVWLLVIEMFNMHAGIEACNCTQGLYESLC